MFCLAKPEPPLQLPKSCSFIRKLQKTQDMINAEGTGPVHFASFAAALAETHKEFVRILDFFLIFSKPFSQFCGLIARPTHDRLTTLRQVSRILRKEKKGGGKTWPASFSFLSATFSALACSIVDRLSARYLSIPQQECRGRVLQ